MKWLRTAGIAIAGILVALGLSIIGRSVRRAEAAQKAADNVILDGSRRAEKRANKAAAKADQAQKEAKDAAERGLKAMDEVGKKDESVASILDGWRADRLQQ